MDRSERVILDTVSDALAVRDDAVQLVLLDSIEHVLVWLQLQLGVWGDGVSPSE